MKRTEVLRILDGDEELFALLVQEGWISARTRAYGTEDLEAARLAATLTHELEVNWPGVEIIMRMRGELLETRRQMADLIELLRRR